MTIKREKHTDFNVALGSIHVMKFAFFSSSSKAKVQAVRPYLSNPRQLAIGSMEATVARVSCLPSHASAFWGIRDIPKGR